MKRIIRYLKGTQDIGLWYERNSTLTLKAYTYSNFVGCKLNRKSTSGACQFLGSNLISWFSKKQYSVALSITKAEYMIVGSCCAQILWIKMQLEDYNIKQSKNHIKCDNTSVINLSKNIVLYSRTKHIDIRHHFIKKQVLNDNFFLDYIYTEDQFIDIFTKPLTKDRFSHLRRELDVFDSYE